MTHRIYVTCKDKAIPARRNPGSSKGKTMNGNMMEAMQAVGLKAIEINTPDDVAKKLGAAFAPASQEPDFWQDAEVISSYSRAQAIEDGVLVDLSDPAGDLAALVSEAGIKFPVAMTAAAFAATIGLTEDLPAGQNVEGRAWDVLMCLRIAIQQSASKATDRVDFRVGVWDGKRQLPVALYALVGPGDQGEPVITIMLPGED